ncbi:hypothetical protein PISL3812_06255 [Talaromyces islandicus]|uniref:F-box domain-containing protein n=1 Tax=Talaromyces islandicus TaxID=28573 RepID=A0A0U1M109_TALIS|nr:hypothetical protein PISL3812_06255 [Talaromyces islandicus]
MAIASNTNDEECSGSHTKSSAKNLMDLPTELHIHIASFLSYPDALALKHSCSHFSSFVDTGVEIKIDCFGTGCPVSLLDLALDHLYKSPSP